MLKDYLQTSLCLNVAGGGMIVFNTKRSCILHFNSYSPVYSFPFEGRVYNCKRCKPKAAVLPYQMVGRTNVFLLTAATYASLAYGKVLSTKMRYVVCLRPPSTAFRGYRRELAHLAAEGAIWPVV